VTNSMSPRTRVDASAMPTVTAWPEVPLHHHRRQLRPLTKRSLAKPLKKVTAVAPTHWLTVSGRTREMNVWEGFAWDSAIDCLVSAKLGTATRAPQQTAAMSTSQTSAKANASAELIRWVHWCRRQVLLQASSFLLLAHGGATSTRARSHAATAALVGCGWLSCDGQSGCVWGAVPLC